MNINKTEALKRLSALEAEGKELRKILEAPENIMDRVKSYEDACEVLGIKRRNFDYCTDDEIAYKKLKDIIKALNEGWIPNWDNDEYKYYCWWYLNEPGLRLDDVYCNYSGANVAPRLCFKTRELAEYAAEKFFDLFKQYYTK